MRRNYRCTELQVGQLKNMLLNQNPIGTTLRSRFALTVSHLISYPAYVKINWWRLHRTTTKNQCTFSTRKKVSFLVMRNMQRCTCDACGGMCPESKHVCNILAHLKWLSVPGHVLRGPLEPENLEDCIPLLWSWFSYCSWMNSCRLVKFADNNQGFF